ncbi:probable glutamate receptor [Homarus americanus]|uniref:probable glutamate receptor n=1 Tax=Homarus americanus TaxID=6706 RepID=UPI001C4465A1|nr:probable glutamate receptor [Homarus americanus]
MISTWTSVFLLLAALVLRGDAKLPRVFDGPNVLTLAHGAIDDILQATLRTQCSVFLFTDGTNSYSSTFWEDLRQLVAPWGMGVFEVAVDGQDANVTQAQLSRVVDEARRLRQVSWCVTVVVVSDDPAFLAAFAEWSLKGRLLVWSTRLLVVTRLPLQELQLLHKVMSGRNTMLLIVGDTSVSLRVEVYVQLPYRQLGGQFLRIATWTHNQGLVSRTHLPLFPDKFSKFLNAPKLKVAAIVMSHFKIVKMNDAESAGDERVVYTGAIANVVEYLSRALNFTYKYVMPPDGSFGTKAEDGSWTGMVGLVSREEADIAIGPFGLTPIRAEAVDFTWPLSYDNTKILAGLGDPEVDPWGFLLPLAPLVWAAILTALLMLLTVILMCSSCLSPKTSTFFIRLTDTHGFIRVLLQQTAIISMEWWWWQRVMLGVWMLMTLVLTRSYAGNLMSLLAVRHIPQPFQSLREVIDDPSTITIWQSRSINAEYLRTAKSGIIQEVADLGADGRVMYTTHEKYKSVVDTLVRRGTHVLVDIHINIRNLMAQDFSQSGRCDFYTSREGYLPFPAGIISQKDNPIVPAMHKRVLALTESGIFMRWFWMSFPNSTKCLNPPKRITVRTSLSLSNLWGMFVVMAGGSVLSLLVLCVELLTYSIF